MSTPNPLVEPYFDQGCGRCPLVGTPECKVNHWRDELSALRSLVLASGLNEELKWGVPCYTLKKKNIVLIHAFKDYCALLFHKGALLKDKNNLLIQQTENVQAGRQIRFTDVRDIQKMTSVLSAYIQEAIEIEQAGLKVTLKTTEEFSVPDEFQRKLDTLPNVKAAFQALTPGRQRAYLLHFSAPKQAKTRESRVEKYLPFILSGKGLHD